MMRRNARLVSSSVPLYEGVKMKAIFQERFELPVYVDNTSNFRVISAHTITKLDNIVCLDISQAWRGHRVQWQPCARREGVWR